NHLQADRLLYEIFKEQLRSYKLIIRGVIGMIENTIKEVELFEQMKHGEPVLFVTSIGYIIGITDIPDEIPHSVVKLKDVYINCVSASRVNRFSKGLTISVDQIIGFNALTAEEMDRMITNWQVSMAPTIG
ncbi:hypothetical protein, partial [Listeria newyorkensis]